MFVRPRCKCPLQSALPFPHQSWPFPKCPSPNSSLSFLLLISPISSSSSSSSPSYSDLTSDEFRAARLVLAPGLAFAAVPRCAAPGIALCSRTLRGGGAACARARPQRQGAEVLAVEDDLIEDEGLDEVGGVVGAAPTFNIAVRVLLSGEGDESVQKMQSFKRQRQRGAAERRKWDVATTRVLAAVSCGMRAPGNGSSGARRGGAEKVGCGSGNGAGGGSGAGGGIRGDPGTVGLDGEEEEGGEAGLVVEVGERERGGVGEGERERECSGGEG
uniref:Uncharacterized protein n=1 Tax=Ananas comosus var. bracteatus TaxID=296719 RepID=A0A6V7QTV7_ANACO